MIFLRSEKYYHVETESHALKSKINMCYLYVTYLIKYYIEKLCNSRMILTKDGFTLLKVKYVGKCPFHYLMYSVLFNVFITNVVP